MRSSILKWASGWLVLLSLMAAGPLACGGTSPPGDSPPGDSPPGVPRLGIRCTFEDGQPIAGVSVVLGEAGTGVTDSNGQLGFDVPPGQYTARLHLQAGDGRESGTEQSIEVGDQSQQLTIKLPRPVQMLEPLEVTTSSVHLAWERGSESSFREYKLYLAFNDSQLKEPKGDLLFVGTDASQTDAVLPGSWWLKADQDLYFRLFVFKEDGSMAASNILHVKTPSWEDTSHFTRFYTLSVEQQFAGDLPIQGIAYDGSSLWLLYYNNVGNVDPDEYDSVPLTLVQLEPGTWRVLKEIPFKDHTLPTGLTWDGEGLWVSFLDGRMMRFNPSTGARERRFMISGAGSLAWSGSQVLLSQSHWIEGVDPVNGAVLSDRPNPFRFHISLALGIAARPGEVWLSDHYADGIVIVNDDGEHIGVVNNSSHFDHMVFMGQKLVGVTEYAVGVPRSSQVVIMNIQE